MTAATYTPKQVAREVAKRLNRTYDAKRVRAWVRDNVAAYDDDGYTAHLYDHATYMRIVTALVKRGQVGRPAAASKGRAGKPSTSSPKPRTTGTTPAAPKVAPVARVAPSVTAESTAPSVKAV